jgi:hypothetical protein
LTKGSRGLYYSYPTDPASYSPSAPPSPNVWNLEVILNTLLFDLSMPIYLNTLLFDLSMPSYFCFNLWDII